MSAGAGLRERNDLAALPPLPFLDGPRSTRAALEENIDRHGKAHSPAKTDVNPAILAGVFRNFVHECWQTVPHVHRLHLVTPNPEQLKSGPDCGALIQRLTLTFRQPATDCPALGQSA